MLQKTDSDPPLIEDEQDVQHFDKRKLIWKIGNLSYDKTTIAHEPNPTDEKLLDLDTPYKCFSNFFTPEFLQKIANETSLYSCLYIKKFVGILIFMSVEHFPSERSYWNEKFGYDPVKTVMPVNKFELIRSLLHFNDNMKHLPKEHPDHDRLHKIRPVIEHLNETFSSIPIDQRRSIDEQIPTSKISA